MCGRLHSHVYLILHVPKNYVQTTRAEPDLCAIGGLQKLGLRHENRQNSMLRVRQALTSCFSVLQEKLADPKYRGSQSELLLQRP